MQAYMGYVGYIILLASLLPAVALGFYIYGKDDSPEPGLELLKAFVLGIAACFLSLLLSCPFEWLGLFTIEHTTIGSALSAAFFGAAIPEECAKLFVLWLMLRRNKHFDENIDGIVYAVFVALGFAFFENMLHLFSSGPDSLAVMAVGRALLCIPGHFGMGVLMGYYYSLLSFYPHGVWKNRILVLAVPILIHGAFDMLVFAMNLLPLLAVPLFILVVIFCFWLWIYGNARIEELRNQPTYPT